MMKTTKPFSTNQKERLILTLLASDVTNALNLVCKVRALKFHLDFQGHDPSVSISRPNVGPEIIMVFNTRKKICMFATPTHPELVLALQDINDRLIKLQAALLLVAEKDRNQKSWGKLQIHVSGARRMALTILDVAKGNTITDNNFELPGD